MKDPAKVVEVKTSVTPEHMRKTILEELRNDFAEWMETDRDMVWRPAIELMKEDNEYAARVLLPGVHAEDVEVLPAPDAMLIKGEVHNNPDYTKLLRSIKFPRPIDLDSVHAEMKDGMLSIRAKIAGMSNVKIFRPRAA
jgi:HSP20 family molecular chaperone IbpA